ncbi:Mitochondrial chaperone bcs1 [Madurella fahalii]|uniref:Mitochondrial chaperone bcs1 n=1 Tax=Madurella fahalii TaxID=1157608 RepID=A0ABQ0GTC4_9PEZI
MDSLLALASARSLLAGASGMTVEDLEQHIPGFAVLQSFFKTWLRLDLTSILTIAAIVRFLTASVSIAGNDRLNREVLNWLGAHVLTKNGTRILTANSERIRNEAWHYSRVSQERNDYHHDKRLPVHYLPTFGTTWFIHQRSLFMVRRILTGSSHFHSSWSSRTPDEYAGAPEGDEPLVIMCLGRSVEPIKKFLEACRDFADKQREAYITVRISKRSYDESWDTSILRPLRPLETVHFDEDIKAALVADIDNYLDPNTRKFYNGRGIPYRRGFLLYGPPGTGKTSLSLALAGKFGLELYLLHIPSVRDDEALERLFTTLPPRCIVLLEDIDAVGIKRRDKPDDDSSNDSGSDSESNSDNEDNRRSNVTISGLLNVLDGVASQEGRIVLMTSNFAEKLDKALVRPGRVDRMIYLGHISPRSSELMFLRMYSPDTDGAVPANPSQQLPEAELKRLALEFSKHIPSEVFTPAQLQGYLLNHRNSPLEAAANVEGWVKEEVKILEVAKEKARKAAELKKKRKRERKLKRVAEMADAMRKYASDEELEDLRQKVEEKAKRKVRRKKDDEGEAEREDVPGPPKEKVDGTRNGIPDDDRVSPENSNGVCGGSESVNIDGKAGSTLREEMAIESECPATEKNTRTTNGVSRDG